MIRLEAWCKRTNIDCICIDKNFNCMIIREREIFVSLNHNKTKNESVYNSLQLARDL